MIWGTYFSFSFKCDGNKRLMGILQALSNKFIKAETPETESRFLPRRFAFHLLWLSLDFFLMYIAHWVSDQHVNSRGSHSFFSLPCSFIFSLHHHFAVFLESGAPLCSCGLFIRNTDSSSEVWLVYTGKQKKYEWINPHRPEFHFCGQTSLYPNGLQASPALFPDPREALGTDTT